MEKKILDEFEEDLLADGKAPKTLVSYVGDVKYFIVDRLHRLKQQRYRYSSVKTQMLDLELLSS